ncbi:aminoglycoside phosphotransferase family protein [Thalassotalea profundi]|uniref:Aminoglycoside phosphotransferase domain-containing protein n=1 Tax=Thalassotalea profundi TaxID=2036687 RepID=A0ABQ3IL50_9GAMM|nr:aminoglycoside phosphotransferase family protein [Thalassotalea profundi]GHE83284.1 hypothetical protein GCM10011501_09650 [Thalassotalea profundi]
MHKNIKLLDELPFFQQRTIISVAEITTGLSQQSFKVRCLNDQLFYAKYFDKYNTEYAQIEKEVLLNSASSPITTSLLYSDEHWLVTPFIEANDLSKLNLPIKNKLNIALELMLTFQKLIIPSKKIKPISFIAHGDYYINALALNKNQQQILRSLLSDDDAIKAQQLTLCHGDFNFTNMLLNSPLTGIASDEIPILIDFECCCYSEVEYDIAMMIAVNNLLNYLSVDTVIAQIKVYLAQRMVNISTKKVMRYLGKSLLLNALWYICRFNRTNDNKWLILAKQQFQQADVLNNNKTSIVDRLKLHLPA